MTEQITRTMQPDATMAIIEQLRSAFPANEIDSRDAFAPWRATYLDGADYAKQLDGKSWNELDRSYLDRRSDALGFLSTKHLVAVLPAYLAELVEGGPFSQVPGVRLWIDVATSTGYQRNRSAVSPSGLIFNEKARNEDPAPVAPVVRPATSVRDGKTASTRREMPTPRSSDWSRSSPGS